MSQLCLASSRRGEAVQELHMRLAKPGSQRVTELLDPKHMVAVLG